MVALPAHLNFDALKAYIGFQCQLSDLFELIGHIRYKKRQMIVLTQLPLDVAVIVQEMFDAFRDAD